ncbi:MAG: hypothetical protein AAGD07_15880 [Planctomycetota bacterium]
MLRPTFPLIAFIALFGLLGFNWADAAIVTDPGLANGERFWGILVTPPDIAATSSSRSMYDNFVTVRGQVLEWQGSAVQGWNALASFGNGTSMADGMRATKYPFSPRN